MLLSPDSTRGELNFVAPAFLPDGNALLFSSASAGNERFDDGRIFVLNLQTNERRVVVDGGMSARYSPSGHLVYARQGSLFAVPFDVVTLAVTGEAFKVLDGVFMSVVSGVAEFDISDDGTLVLRAWTGRGRRSPTRVGGPSGKRRSSWSSAPRLLASATFARRRAPRR